MKNNRKDRPTPEVLGGFEHQVLLTVERLGGETYSVPIVVELETRTGRTVAPAAVFATLRRLEARRLLRSRTAEPEPGRLGRPHRVFEITAAGRAALREARRVLTALWTDSVSAEEA